MLSVLDLEVSVLDLTYRMDRKIRAESVLN